MPLWGARVLDRRGPGEGAHLWVPPRGGHRRGTAFQTESLPFITRLCDAVYGPLETSGAVDITPVDPRAHVIMDVKCRGAHDDRMHWPNLSQLAAKDEAKFVLADRADYDWAREILAQYDVASRCSVLFSPVFGSLDMREMAEWILADKLPVRFQMQLHKYIWAPDMRGV